MNRRWLMGALVALTLVGCSHNPKPESATGSSLLTGSVEAPLTGTAKMEIEDFTYKPQALVVKKGTTLQITNNDLSAHTVTAADGTFDSSFIGANETKSVTFDKVGTYKVACKPHPSITGTITVVE